MNNNNGIVNYEESIVTKIQNNNFTLSIDASSFSSEVYTNNYIKNLFNSLEETLENCETTIKQATMYFEKLAESENIKQPELIELSYAFEGSVIDLEANAQVVTKNPNGNLNIHASASLNGDNVRETLSNGTYVKILGEENGMYKIEYEDGKIGYVSKDYIKINEELKSETLPTEPKIIATETEKFENYNATVKINDDNSHLNIRSGPSTSNGVIASFNQGENINVIGESEDGKWLQVQYNDKDTGWVYKEYVTQGEETNVITNTSSISNTSSLTNNSIDNTFDNYSVKVTLNDDNSHLNFRNGPSIDNEIIGSFSQGAKLNIIGESEDGKWLKVDYDGKIGYVSKSKVSSIE